MKTSTALAILPILASYATAAPADTLEERGVWDKLKGSVSGPDDNYKGASQTNQKAFSSALEDEILCIQWTYPTKNGAPKNIKNLDQLVVDGNEHTDLICGNVQEKNTKFKATRFVLQKGKIGKGLEVDTPDFDYGGEGQGKLTWLGKVDGMDNGKPIKDVSKIKDPADDIVKHKDEGQLASSAFVTQLWGDISGNGTTGEEKHHILPGHKKNSF
ncbi:hypothetical protein EV356DRAFT_566172 [Viridothelium virens]|uniref:Uncharacterized protein n=1 Tax=Viridothelium virens TaxID=1048519 RepID=A0A6A6HCH3_VIRVR|nr:hypothetical protein EV356DRAFT_566172 [Viridothelium virens]